MAFRMRRLGRTNWNVTELGMGCYQFTGEFGVSQEEATKILDVAFESGINFIDTAAMYGFGESEESGRPRRRPLRPQGTVPQFQGRLAGPHGGSQRGQRGVSERGRPYAGDQAQPVDPAPGPPGRDDDPRARLGPVGPEPCTGDSAITTVLEKLKGQGVIGAIGMGGWNCDVIAALIETGRFDVALIAGGISLLGQPIKNRVLPAAKKHDVGIILGGAMGQGGLVAKDREAAKDMIDNPRSVDQPARARKLLAIFDLSDKLGLSLPEMAIRYVATFGEIHTHIAGAREAAHLKANIAAVQAGPLPADAVARIEAIGRGEV